MIHTYKIGNREIEIDLEKQINDLINSNPEKDFSNGLSSRTERTAIKNHIKTKLVKAVDMNTAMKFLLDKKINRVTEEITDLIHISLILKHNLN